MKELNFFPEWYVNKQAKAKNGFMLLIIISMLLIDIISFNKVLDKKNEYDNKINMLSAIKSTVALKQNSLSKMDSNNLKNNKTIDNFLSFYQELFKNVDFSRIEVKDVDIDIEAKYTDKFPSIIKSVEENKDYLIKSVMFSKKNGDDNSVQIILSKK